MSEAGLIVMLVALLGIGGIAGVAYSLEARRKRHGAFGPKLPPRGRVGRLLWWAARALTALMVLAAAGAYLFGAPALARFALGCFVLFFGDHAAYAVVRLRGK